MTVPATSGLQPQSDCRCPKTRAKPARFFLSVTLPTAGRITWWFLRPFPALGQRQPPRTSWTGFTRFLWSLEQLYKPQSCAKYKKHPAGCCHHPGRGVTVCEANQVGGGGGNIQKEAWRRGEPTGRQILQHLCWEHLVFSGFLLVSCCHPSVQFHKLKVGVFFSGESKGVRKTAPKCITSPAQDCTCRLMTTLHAHGRHTAACWHIAPLQLP